MNKFYSIILFQFFISILYADAEYKIGTVTIKAEGANFLISNQGTFNTVYRYTLGPITSRDHFYIINDPGNFHCSDAIPSSTYNTSLIITDYIDEFHAPNKIINKNLKVEDFIKFPFFDTKPTAIALYFGSAGGTFGGSGNLIILNTTDNQFKRFHVTNCHAPNFTEDKKSLNLETFLNNLYFNNQNNIINHYKEDYLNFCNNYNLNCQNEANIKDYNFLRFLHELFTNSSASDFNTGGILKIPYFSHWGKKENWPKLERHNIIQGRMNYSYYPDELKDIYSTKLIDIEPTASLSCALVGEEEWQVYKKYKSYSYMDRRPELFLSDLFSLTPQYYHEKIGEFYSFGWCSEKEPAFSSILKLLNYKHIGLIQ